MLSNRFSGVLLLLLASYTLGSTGESMQGDVAPLLEQSCMLCHNEATVTPLNMRTLGYDLSDSDSFHIWERIYDRVVRGEMPPVGIPLPDDVTFKRAMDSLKHALTQQSLQNRNGQRVALRRLTRLEYAHTLHDLLGISERDSNALSLTLPAEAETIGFNTIAANQGISALHIKSYLNAANRALDLTLDYGPKPPAVVHKIDYSKSGYLAFAEFAQILGFGIVKRLEDAFVAYFDAGATYMFHSGTEGYAVPHAGSYRISVSAYPYQAETPVVLTIYRGRSSSAAASLDELIGSFDLETQRTVEVQAYLVPGDIIAVSVADLETPPGIPVNYYDPKINVQNYKGEGIAFQSMTFEGPLNETWPPQGTQELLRGVAFDDEGGIVLSKEPLEHIREIVENFASRAFRRPLYEGEGEIYVGLAKPLLEEGRPFLEALRLPLRAILSAPSFLYLNNDIDSQKEFVLATRLAYFLWRSVPDAELLQLAGNQQLSDPEVLKLQTERMLKHPKFDRFLKDFVGQAFRLNELRATSPDSALYPEFDDRLGQAIALETELFLGELIKENHCVDKLIDSDFTFLNRRLAEHYQVEGVQGQHMRRTVIPADSPRGGLITQASIHKVTANGTVTSPVPRGNFVLENLLGTPVPPPPPGIAGLEPDTRGTTTIREMLTAHRSDAVCAGCHQTIDPPGFALESFDPIGGFRQHYRVSGPKVEFGGNTYPGPYQQGPAVDPSGITPTGKSFTDIEGYKEILKGDVEQIARHFISQLFAFSTGAMIDFADRDAVESIVEKLQEEDFPIRSMIHEVVQHDLFAQK